MNASVQFLFDFGSPNAYLCHKVLPALEQRTGVAVQYCGGQVISDTSIGG